MTEDIKFRHRGVKVHLDPTTEQLNKIQTFAGASRWAYNYALAIKLDIQQQWFDVRDTALAMGMEEKEARKEASGRFKVPN